MNYTLEVWKWIDNFIPHFTGHVLLIVAGIKISKFIHVIKRRSDLNKLNSVIRGIDNVMRLAYKFKWNH